MVIWRLSDGRPGHDNQSFGLIEAIGRRVSCDVHLFEIKRQPAIRSVPRLLRESAQTPDPQLLVGVGHATHLPLLALRWRRGGHSVVMMRPSLPRRLFDVCIVPGHDGLADDASTLVTRGAVNRVRPAAQGKRPHSALVLVGGPSSGYGWAPDEMMTQVRALTAIDDGVEWQLCDSRRTPPVTREALRTLAGGRVGYAGFDTVGSDWLASTLAVTETVWVSEDSVSMVYEALSAHAAVGLLEVPRVRAGRVASGVDALRADGWVCSFADWRAGHAPSAPRKALAEADRCAEWLMSRWLTPA